MKTNIYIDEGVTQIVLTPETEFEKSIVKDFDFKGSTATIFKGSFSDCRGGWVRLYNNQDSIMIKCEYKPEGDF